MNPDWTTIESDPYLSAALDEARSARESDAFIPGRIVAQDGPLFEVVTPRGAWYARLSGALRHQLHLGSVAPPAVGDYVALGTAQESPIRRILPRRTVYERKEAGIRAESQVICANIDLTLIVTTAPAEAARPDADRSSLHDFSVRRVERFIATLDPRVRPVVVINKCDLIDEPDAVRSAVEAQLPGADVVLISALSGDGVEALGALVGRGATAVLVGSSGSGKSTLIGKLTGHDVRTGAVRAADGRGRHTTTGRRLYAAGAGGMLIDTPGVREVQLWGGEDAAAKLGSAFPEIDALAADCRFSDCSHTGEPGCAVRAAVQAGDVTQERYLSYLELQEEHDVTAARAEKRERLTNRRHARKSRMQRRSRGS